MSALARLAASPRPRLAFVSHAFGGGVGRHIDELARSIADAAEVLLLKPHGRDHLALRWLREGESMALFWRRDEWKAVVGLLADLGIARVHCHHVHGLPEDVLDLPSRLACPYDVTLHDHFPVCPSYHLTGGDGRYCGGEPGCQRCLESGPAPWPLTIDAWRARFASWLAGAERVIAPSHACARRLHAFFPAVEPVVWPHPEAPARGTAPIRRIAVPGAISPAKGLDVLEACARDAAERRLPLHFRVLGFLARPIPEWPELPLTISGEYPEGRLDELVAFEHADAFFFPAQCPETFSYTLSAALESGRPIVATDLGALPERLAGRSGVTLVRWDAPPRDMNDALMALPVPAAAAATPVARVAFEAYRERYLAPIRSAAPRPAREPRVQPAWLEEPALPPAPWTLAALFDDAVRSGRASSVEELARRTAAADHDLEQAAWDVKAARAEADRVRSELAASRAEAASRATRLAALQDQVRDLAGRLAASEAHVEEIHASRSWRLTAPLRALTRRLRRGS